MSGRLELVPLTEVELKVLVGLCALADAGEPPVPFVLTRRTDITPNNLYRTVNRLSEKGWIARRRKCKAGFSAPVRIIARPTRVENPDGHSEAPSESSHRHPNDVPRDRDCMTCGTTFRSAGWGNRRCDRCRSRTDDDWMGGLVS